jgi:fido (protein-threonine AMPylation protein)
MQDPYFYPGTEVLINLKNIRDREQLLVADSLLPALTQDQIAKLSGLFDQQRLQDTHKALFGELYAWAGQLRQDTGTMTKGRDGGYSVTYGDSRYVPQQLADIFQKLKSESYLQNLDPQTFSIRGAYYYGELDAAHPFRDGNSRTLRQFTSDLAVNAGYRLDWKAVLQTDLDIQRLFLARDMAVLRGDSSQLAQIVRENLSPLNRSLQRSPDEQRHWEPLEKALPIDQSREFQWTGQNGTVQSYRHMDTGNYLHIDGPTGQFYDRDKNPITREAALDHAFPKGHEHSQGHDQGEADSGQGFGF